jgi:hypothetical protein
MNRTEFTGSPDETGRDEDGLEWFYAVTDLILGLGDEDDEPYEDEADDGESAFESLARLAAEIEAGRAELYAGWKLDRPRPGVLVWTMRSGRQYASTVSGDCIPLADAYL